MHHGYIQPGLQTFFDLEAAWGGDIFKLNG
jgi:hypothetical protein